MTGCDKSKGCGTCRGQPLSKGAASFLSAFARTPFLPAYRCVLPDGSRIGPLCVLSAKPSMSGLLRSAESVGELARLGLVRVDYDIPLRDAGTADADLAAIRARFPEAAALESGSAALTVKGQEAADELEQTGLYRYRGCGVSAFQR